MASTLDEVRGRMGEAAVDALNRAAEDLAGRAQRAAPIDEGTLRASAAIALIVNGTRFDGTGAVTAAKAAARAAARAGSLELNAEVSFNTVYAARQHEELDWVHPRGGGPKYLERPLLEQANRYERIIALAVSNTI